MVMGNDKAKSSKIRYFKPLKFIFCLAPEDLYEQLVKLGFKNPSRIQALVIKTTRNNPGVVAQSQNGSGKTLAFMIPALMSIDPKQETRDENG